MALAFHLAVTTVALWPAVRDFTTRPIGGGGDSSIFYWSWWHLPRAVLHGAPLFRTRELMYPVGVDLSVTVTAPAIGLGSWPVRALFGPEAQVNAVQLGSAVLAAFLAYLLLLRVCRHAGVAAVLGAAYAFMPYRVVQQSEHLNLIHTGLLPAALLLALRLGERRSMPSAAALGALLGFTVLVEPQLALLGGIGVLALLSGRRLLGRDLIRPGALGAGVALAVAAPVLVPLVRGIAAGESSAPPAASDLAFVSSSPLSWVVPSPTHPWFGGLADFEILRSNLEGVAAPGLLLIALAVGGAYLGMAERRRGWVLLTWVGVILSLGPYLTVGERQAPVPLPYLLLRAVPFMDTMRAPGRFALVGVLGVCVLAAMTLAGLIERHPARRHVLLVGVALVAGLELLPGTPTSRTGGAPEAYEAIASQPGDAAVLEIPLQWSTGVELVGYDDLNVTLFMAWATVHGKPYVGGSVSRLAGDRLARLEAIPLYQQVRALQGDRGFGGPADFTAHDLRTLGIGFVVYHRDVPVPAVRRYVESLDLPVLADDGTVIVWSVPEV